MIGAEVRRRREELGMTGAQLAARAGLAPSAVSQIETGRRTPSSASVVKLAEGLGVEVGALYPKKAQAPLLPPDVGGGELGAYFQLVNRQLERFLSGEDPKLVVAGLSYAASRLVEWTGQDFEGEARKLSELQLPVLAEADPNSLYWPLEVKRLEEALESLEKAPEESRKV
jgi:transcriptional regulator with XRE-family HTH domain